jgi:predicted RNase H-like HicB family nuclease
MGLKYRILQDGNFRNYKIQYKGWFFWKDWKNWEGCWAGGDYITRTFKSISEAQDAWIKDQLEQHHTDRSNIWTVVWPYKEYER